LISIIKRARKAGSTILRSMAVKGIFAVKSRQKDTERKNTGIHIFLVSKFIASNKTM
jgi:hypothetical protein